MTIRVRMPASVDLDARTAELIAATAAPVARGDHDEVLTITADAVDLSRINAGGVPLLDAHRPGSVADQLGTATAARIEAGQLIVAVRFATGPAAEDVLQNVASGIIKGVSIGYEVLDFKDETAPNGDPVRRVTRWRLIEVSLVPVPADGSARVRGHALADVQALSAICTRNGLGEADAADIMRRGRNLNEWRALVLDRLAERDERGVGLNAISDPMGHGNADPRQAIAEALFLRTRPDRVPSYAARAYCGRSLETMLRDYVSRVDPRSRDLGRHELFTRAMSTGDLPSILLNVANKELQERFEVLASPLLQIGRPTTFPDFRAKAFAKVSDFPALQEVMEGAEITYGAFSDDREEVRVRRFARLLRLTREVIVNDDLQALADGAEMAALAIAESQAVLLVGLLLANSGAGATMRDGGTAFLTARGNVGTAAALSETSLAAAAVAMRRQTALGGNPIANEPKFLVVPPELEVTARKLVTAITAPTSTAAANPFSNLIVLVDPRLTSATRWWLFSDPARVPFLRYGGLEGQGLPRFEARDGWSTDTVEMRVIDYFGAGVVEPKAGVTNAGA